MLRGVGDDIETPYKIVPDIFNFCEHFHHSPNTTCTEAVMVHACCVMSLWTPPPELYKDIII